MLTAIAVKEDPSRETQVTRDDEQREATDQGHMLRDLNQRERALSKRVWTHNDNQGSAQRSRPRLWLTGHIMSHWSGTWVIQDGVTRIMRSSVLEG